MPQVEAVSYVRCLAQHLMSATDTTYLILRICPLPGATIHICICICIVQHRIFTAWKSTLRQLLIQTIMSGATSGETHYICLLPDASQYVRCLIQHVMSAA
jgi:hypothetical protein